MVRIPALQRKLLRDLWRMRLQSGAIALLIACGVSVAVMAFSAQAALVVAQRSYYLDTRFGDVFATARRAPLSAAARLARIDGVIAVDPRAAKVGLMQIPGMVRPAMARLIALPDNPRASLNQLILMQGRYPDAYRTDEVVALKTFLDAAHVRLGERLAMVVDGRRMQFKVVGSVLSPEFVYLPAAGSMLPDDSHQGIFWAPRRTAEKATGLGGAFSMVSLRLASAADAPAILAAVDRILAPYGGVAAVTRRDQVSNKFQQDRIDRFGILAWAVPPVFLLVAASLVHMVLGRMIDREREQIGLLKAFGYENLEAASIYLEMAAAIGLAGAIAGGVVGAWMAQGVTQVLALYMRFPHLEPRFSWAALATSALISILAAMSGSLLAVCRAVRLTPATAMRPPAPARFRPGIIERLPVWDWFDQPTRMIIRNLARFRWRALVTLLGLSVSLSLLIGTQFMFGSFDEILDQAYFRARHWTEFVGFAENRDISAIEEIRRLPGVIAAEPMRYVPARARANGREEKAFITGMDSGARLERAIDASGLPIPFEGRGVIVSASLAARLGVRPGDSVELEATEGRRPRILLPVTAEAQDYAGLSLFMERGALNRMMGDGNLASSAELVLADDQRPAFYRGIERMPQIVGGASRTDTIAAFRGTVLRIMTVEMSIFAGFAAAIAFGVAFNVSRIALSERGRDLATLRVLGFGPAECAYILLGELLLLALIGIPLGLLGGIGLSKGLVAAFSRQEMTLPMVMTPHGLGVATSAYIAAVLVAAVLVGMRVWSLDLISVLKTRE